MVRRLIGYGAAFALTLTLLGGWPGAGVAQAQDQSPSATTPADARREEVNHDVQLYLLAASNEPGGRGGVPASLDGVIRQLRAALPFSNYRLASTFLNRVRDGGSLEVSGVGGGSPLAAGAANPNSPTFFSFNLTNVKLITGGGDQPFIRVSRLRFGLKVPVQTATVGGEGGKPSYPVLQYQDTGISTEVSVREGTPTVVGTMTSSRPDEPFILVLTLKRTPAR